MFKTAPGLVVAEACGTAHDWGRMARQAGHQDKLLPAQSVKPYRRRNKTDRADTQAILEAAHLAAIVKPAGDVGITTG